MAYYDALISKWNTLSGTTDIKLSQINSLTVAGPDRLVPISEISDMLRSQGAWLPIKAAVTTSVGAAAAIDLNEDQRLVTIDINLPIVGQMLADLVSHSLLTQVQADAIVALKNTTTPWWQVNGYTSPINNNDLLAAGGLI